MKITKIGIFILSLLSLTCFSSCKEHKALTKLLINEVMVENETNFQDDYGKQNAWIEIFNKSYGSVDLAADYIKVSSTPGDTISYRIPKGDILTMIKPRQHSLFWADKEPNRGTFHTNFTLDTKNNNWIGLYDSGNKILDQIVVPGGILKADQSYGRVIDGSDEWEVKTGSGISYVTPSTNNKTQDSNVKMEKFQKHDKDGFGMSITAMGVVFIGLILLFISFKIVGKVAVRMSKRNAMKASGITDIKEAKENLLGEAPGEVYAAIAMAMHEMQNDVHDVEDTVLTINPIKRRYSPWSSKIYTLRETPRRK